jgi:uncharacterized protein (DUF4415 family)
MNKKHLKPPFARELTTQELVDLKDEDIDFSDIPEITDEMWKNAVTMQPEDWQKRQLTLRLDPDIIDFFKAQGRGYQTRMNEVLRVYVDAMKK